MYQVGRLPEKPPPQKNRDSSIAIFLWFTGVHLYIKMNKFG